MSGRIEIRVSAEDHETLTNAAAKAKVPVGRLLRESGLKMARRILDEQAPAHEDEPVAKPASRVPATTPTSTPAYEYSELVDTRADADEDEIRAFCLQYGKVWDDLDVMERSEWRESFESLNG